MKDDLVKEFKLLCNNVLNDEICRDLLKAYSNSYLEILNKRLDDSVQQESLKYILNFSSLSAEPPDQTCRTETETYSSIKETFKSIFIEGHPPAPKKQKVTK